MIKKVIILSLLGSTLLLTGCSKTHQIDDIPNYDDSSFKTATLIYHHRGSHYRERDHIVGFPSDVQIELDR